MPMPGRLFCLRTALATALVSGLVTAQSADFRTFGSSCGPANLALTARGLPRFGHTLVIEYSGPFGFSFVGPVYQLHQPFLILGASDTLFRGVALPWNLPILLTGGIPGCQLLVAADLVFAIPLSAGPVIEYPLAIPSIPSAAGIPFFMQWILGSSRLDTRTGVVIRTTATSNAGRAALGW
jgi:hypothetical protein